MGGVLFISGNLPNTQLILEHLLVPTLRLSVSACWGFVKTLLLPLYILFQCSPER